LGENHTTSSATFWKENGNLNQRHSKPKLRMFAALFAVLAVALACITPEIVIEPPVLNPGQPTQQLSLPPVDEGQRSIPTLAPSNGRPLLPNTGEPESAEPGPEVAPGVDSRLLVRLHDQLNPGVVNISTIAQSAGRTGQGAGSGFILDERGYIVTNHHVIESTVAIAVTFFDGYEVEAELVGSDSYSDLAVLRVRELPENVHPLPLGDSNQVRAGEWVVAIGNPFGHSSSMTLGIVSAVGRSIPSGVSRFSIPEAIQTDAAINPGNSGGPLLNLAGEVIGVNAQIATSGIAANAGVGFAIPVNTVRRVIPVLIERGAYQWPYLGVEGDSVSRLIQSANQLESQQGAYIDAVVPGGPAERGGLRGSRGTRNVNGFSVPVGGDIVLEANGEPVQDFNSLLVIIASHNPGDTLTLTVLRDGERIQIQTTLAPRP
jgi:S1-C subfamily serine protease